MVAQEVLVRDDISIEETLSALKAHASDVVSHSACADSCQCHHAGDGDHHPPRLSWSGDLQADTLSVTMAPRFTFYKFRSMYHNVASDSHEKAIVTWMNGAAS